MEHTQHNSDTRLASILGYISTLEKKQVASVKISFTGLIDVVRHPGQETLVVPNLEIVFKD